MIFNNFILNYLSCTNVTDNHSNLVFVLFLLAAKVSFLARDRERTVPGCITDIRQNEMKSYTKKNSRVPGHALERTKPISKD